MNNTGLVQPPYDTSLVGVVKGALDYYGVDTAPAETFALSGHAFAINFMTSCVRAGRIAGTRIDSATCSRT